jgi:hypothetical protein
VTQNQASGTCVDLQYTGSCQGQVELYRNGRQGTTCHDNLNSSHGTACCSNFYAAPVSPPSPQPSPTQCSTTSNGFCSNTNTCAPIPVGDNQKSTYKVTSDPQGCTGSTPLCCAPQSVGKGQPCGTNPGDPSCQSPYQCVFNKSSGNSALGTCQLCGGVGTSCGNNSVCCTNQSLMCDTVTTQTCVACLAEGKSGCGSTPCCNNADTCTVNGTCSSCQAGNSCTGNGDCCSGQTCLNKKCLNNDQASPAQPTTTEPTVPPACPNNQCNTALGIINVANGQGFVSTLFRLILSLSGGIALMLIIYSGYQIAISTGNPEKVKGAKETLTAALIGLAFIIFSMAILQIIGVDILGIFSK